MALQANPRILVVDDEPDFASALKMALTSKLSAKVTLAGDCASARQALADFTFDIVTMDNELPDGNGTDLMEEIVSQADHPPVVMVTGKGDEKTAARACSVGAAGYVVKDQKLKTMLVSVVQNALDRAHSFKLQSDSEIRYRRLFETARDGILILDADTGEVIDANPYLTELLGYTLEEFVGKHLWEIGSFKDAELSKEAFEELRERRYVRYEHLPLETKEGRIAEVEFVSNIYLSDHREVIQCNIRDITVRKEKEAILKDQELELARAKTLLEETGRMARVGGWEVDVETGKQTWTPETYRIHEVDPDFEPTVEKGIAFYAPEAVPVVSEAVRRAIEDGDPFDLELRFITARGNERWVHAIGKAERVGGKTVKVRGIFQDITERKQAEERRELVAKLLLVLNRSKGNTDAINEILGRVKEFAGFEAVGIRIKKGDDYPYYETSGFPESFVELERNLCAYEKGEVVRDTQGKVVLECMCGNVIQGRTDPSLPFFTEGGSFWSNNTTELLASTTEEDRQARTRNRCNGEGYESVALIPLKFGEETIGLLQFNDKRTDMFTLDLIEFFEEVGASIGVVLARKEAESALAEAEKKYRALAEALPQVVFEIDMTGRILYLNDNAYKMFGYSREEVDEDFNALQVFDESDRERLVGAIGKMVDGHSDGAVREYKGKRKDGTIFPVRAYTSLLTDDSGDRFGIRGILIDITEERTYETYLRIVKEQWERTFKSVSESIFLINLEFKRALANHLF